AVELSGFPNLFVFRRPPPACMGEDSCMAWIDLPQVHNRQHTSSLHDTAVDRSTTPWWQTSDAVTHITPTEQGRYKCKDKNTEGREEKRATGPRSWTRF